MKLKELKRKFFIENNLASKKEQYTDKEIKEQLTILKTYIGIINSVKEELFNGELKDIDSSIKEEAFRYAIASELTILFSKIENPSSSDFYRRETVEYILKHRDSIRQAVTNYIENKGDRFKRRTAFYYTENLEENVNEIVTDSIGIISAIEYCNSERFNKIREKILNNTLEAGDIDELTDFVTKQIYSYYKHEGEVYSDVKKNSAEVTRALIKHIKKSMDGKTYRQRPTIQNPFYGNDKANNYEVYVNFMMASLEEDLKQQMAEYVSTSGNDINYTFLGNLLRKTTSTIKRNNIEENYRTRILEIIKYLHDHDELKKYIDTNNKKMYVSKIGELETDESSIISSIENMDINGRDSFECLVGLSAFYCNRICKVVSKFGNVAYILNKYDVFKKVSMGQDIDFESLGITEEDLRTYMAEYEILSKVVNSETNKYYAKKEIDFDLEKNINETIANIKGKSGDYSNIDGINFEGDIELVYNSSSISAFYEMKKEAINKLVYVALKDNKSSIINWGYVKGDRNEDEGMLLIAFDIRSLNTPLYFHIGKETIIDLVSAVTGDTKIPVYKGENDIDVGVTKITSQIAYPASKAKKKEIKKAKSNSFAQKYLAHIKWLLDGKSIPEHLKDIPDEEYDIETGEILPLRTMVNDNPDDDIDLT